MHVLLITPTYPNRFDPTLGIFYRDQAEALAAAGHRVGVLAMVPVSLKAVAARRRLRFGLWTGRQRNVDAWVVEWPSVPKARRFNAWVRRELSRRFLTAYTAKHGKPDVLHVHGAEVGDVALEASAALGKPYVITEHSSVVFNAAEPIPMAMRAYAGATARLAVSEALARALTARYRLPFRFVPNVVDLTLFPLRKSRPGRGLFVFVNVGYLTAVKNHPLLLSAYAEAFGADPGFALKIAGDGPDRAELETLATRLGIAGRVEFLGPLDRQAVSDLLQASDCLVLSSRVETFGVVLIEALATGLPVVATRCGGPESIVTNESLGLLVEPTVTAMAAALRSISRTTFSPQALRDSVSSRFSAPIVARQISAALSEAFS